MSEISTLTLDIIAAKLWVHRRNRMESKMPYPRQGAWEELDWINETDITKSEKEDTLADAKMIVELLIEHG